MTPQHIPGGNPPFNLEGAIVFTAAAVAKGESYASFAARFLANTDILMPAPAHGNLREDPGLRRRVAIALVRALWRQMPDPTHRYAPAPLPNPERNAPCHCGSGLKYKKCCEPIERGVPIERMNLLPQLLEALPKKRWAELVGSRIALEMVGVTAHEWSGEGKDTEAMTLLEPWFADDSHLDGRHELMFDTLLEVYTHLGKPRKKATLLDRALAQGDRAIRSAAIQRQICMHADQGDYDAAWKLFGEAQRADPDSPSLSHVEVTILISEGREAEARERARFWVMRLQRRGDPDLADLIGFLDNIANHGSGAMLDLAADREPAVGELIEAFRRAPPVACAYTLTAQDDSAGPLNATADLAEALADWEETFPNPYDLEFPEDAEAEIWASAPDWLALLDQRPILWQCFEVIDSLVQAVLMIPVPGTETLAIELLDRAERLLREVIRANSAEGLKVEWGWLQNRTALSLIGERITIDRDQSPSAENLARMEWLVRTLNPGDNQGFRTRLLRHYLELGRYDDALAFADLYPDDFAAMQYTRALALFALNRIDDATLALKNAIAQYPKLLTWLLKPRPKPPRSDGFGIAVGGDEEAWIYRRDHLSLWQDLGAMEWAGLVKRSSKR
jgi:tetratricopeptide (TPR) repeat protein